MGLAQVVYPPPTPDGFKTWLFDHYQDHLAIIQRASTLGYSLTQYRIWPVTEQSLQDFLQQHSFMHNEMNAIANVQGSDLEDIDFKDKKKLDAWYYLNFIEHQSVHSFLGGGI